MPTFRSPAPRPSPDGPRPRSTVRAQRPRGAGRRSVGVALWAAVGAGAIAPGGAAAQAFPEAVRALDGANAAAWSAPWAEALARLVATGPPSRVVGAGFSVRGGVGIGVSLPPGGRFAPAVPESATFGGTTYADAWEVSGDGTAPTAAEMGSALLQPRSGSPFEQALLDAGQDPSSARWTRAIPGGVLPEAVWVPTVEAAFVAAVGTRLFLRGAPAVDLHEGVGDVGAVGGGLAQDVGRFLFGPESRLSLSAAGSVHRTRVGGVLTVRSATAGLAGELRLGALSVRADGGWLFARSTLAYPASNPEASPLLPADGARVTVSVPVDGGFRGGAGLALRHRGLRLIADWAPGRGHALLLRIQAASG